jgi:sulfotransferase family protein
MSSRQPILVTGSHRSGTGWVGQMLSATPHPPVAYLWEPFSILARPGIRSAPFRYWFPYVCTENEAAFRGAIQDMLDFHYKPFRETASIRSPKDAGRMLRDWAVTERHRRRGARPLLKDPIAVFSSEWLVDTWDMQAIVLIRHPAGFVDSVVRRKLRHPFGDFLAQPLLMRDLLSPFEDRVRWAAAEERPLLDQGILLWNLIHHSILRFREHRADWIFVRLEDVAREPVRVFGEMYDRLGLTWDARVGERIQRTSSEGNPRVAERMASVTRDSKASTVAWKAHLSAEQVSRIREGVRVVSDAFYDDDDW